MRKARNRTDRSKVLTLLASLIRALLRYLLLLTYLTLPYLLNLHRSGVYRNDDALNPM